MVRIRKSIFLTTQPHTPSPLYIDHLFVLILISVLQLYKELNKDGRVQKYVLNEFIDIQTIMQICINKVMTYEILTINDRTHDLWIMTEHTMSLSHSPNPLNHQEPHGV